MKKSLATPGIFSSVLVPLCGLTLVLGACAKDDASRNWQPPPACMKGLNTNGCGPDIQDGSSWKTEFKVLEDDTRETKFVVSSYYQFGSVEGKQKWERFVIVDGGVTKGKRVMYEGGDIEQITGNSMALSMTTISCPSEMADLATQPKKFNLYYQRSGDSLRTSELPITETHASGGFGSYIGDVIGNAIGGIFVRVFEGIFQGIFSLGSARQWIEMGGGQWQKIDHVNAADLGIMGCFGSVGNSFKSMALPTVETETKN